MPRQVRIEFPGAIYHVMCRGDRREEIFRSDEDREMMLATLAETVEKTGWVVHAWVWMGNHYHLLVETPEANLVKGMTWFQTTYTIRFNARHRMRGHLFGGRYKAVVVDSGEPQYFRTLLDYIHLNPVRAGIIKARHEGGDLRDYPWSSWSAYVHPHLRQPWHQVSRAFREWGLEDTVGGRRALRLRIERRMAEEAGVDCGRAEIAGQSLQSTLLRGWCYGSESFREHLLERAGELLGQRRQSRKNYHGDEVKSHGESEARALLASGLAEAGIQAADLPRLLKSDPRKVIIATQIRRRTAMPLVWIAQHLHMGTSSNVSQACRRQSSSRLS
jgi:REP element-mobilizing transposase RayT